MSPQMAKGNNTWMFSVVSADALATGASSINPQMGPKLIPNFLCTEKVFFSEDLYL